MLKAESFHGFEIQVKWCLHLNLSLFLSKRREEVSEPVQTIYGWHILKLIDKKAVPSFEEVRADIERKIKRDSRANKGKTVLINKLSLKTI